MSLSDNLSLHIYVDSSSVEIFMNQGSVTFTERMYWQDKINLSLLADCDNQSRIYQLERNANSY